MEQPFFNSCSWDSSHSLGAVSNMRPGGPGIATEYVQDLVTRSYGRITGRAFHPKYLLVLDALSFWRFGIHTAVEENCQRAAGQKWRGRDSVGLLLTRSLGGPVRHPATPVQSSPHSLWSQHMRRAQGSPGSALWQSRFYPWSLFGLLLPFSPLPLAPSAHADENPLPSYGPHSHESYPVHHLEGKKSILPRNPGDQSTS